MKKVLSLILSAVMIASTFFMVDFSVFAQTSGESAFIQNPAYSGKSVSYSSYRTRSVQAAKKYNGATYYTDTSGYITELRDAMVAREEDQSIYYTSQKSLTDSQLESMITALFMDATSDEYSVSCVDGDYIRWQWGGYYYFWDREYSGGNYYYEIELYIVYYDSASEEKKVDRIIQNYFKSFDLNAYSDYELIKKFHDYVCSIVAYDYHYLYRTDYYDFSAYGAFAKGSAVCQGYALAFYRLCKEAGIDVRFVSSDPDEGCHAWNLVNLGGKYYFVDCTWDDEDDGWSYDYFMKNYSDLRSSDTRYNQHLLYDELYSDSYFEKNYYSKISDSSYSGKETTLGNCVVTVQLSGTYSQSNLPVITVRDDGTTLKQGTDYSVSYSNATASAGPITITGLGDYISSKIYRYISIGGKSANLAYSSVTFDNTYKTPAASVSGLTEGKDYNVYYYSNKNAGSAKVYIVGAGNYKGSILKTFTINPAQLKSSMISLSSYTYTYSGKQKKPAVTVTGEAAADYSVKYVNNVNIGVATVQVTAQGNYTGTANKTFKIKPPKATGLSTSSYNTDSVTLKWDKNSSVKGYVIQQYKDGRWKTIKTITNWKTASYKVTELKPGTVYKFRIATYKIVDSEKWYSSYSSAFKVITRPKQAAVKKTRSSSGKITVGWKKITASGYQVQLSAYSDFSYAKTIDISGNKTVSATFSNLLKGKKYYVRVRAYKTSGSKTVYGKWSTKKVVTCQ